MVSAGDPKSHHPVPGNGAMIYVDPDGRTTGCDDVFTRIYKCRAHYAANGLGVDYINQFIR
jgi:2,4'-dihydroxyacetophenone dioxygenase